MEESKKQKIEEKLRKLLMAKEPEADKRAPAKSLPALVKKISPAVRVIRRRKGAVDMHIAQSIS